MAVASGGGNGCAGAAATAGGGADGCGGAAATAGGGADGCGGAGMAVASGGENGCAGAAATAAPAGAAWPLASKKLKRRPQAGHDVAFAQSSKLNSARHWGQLSSRAISPVPGCRELPRPTPEQRAS
jgi:hypothetical protein